MINFINLDNLDLGKIKYLIYSFGDREDVLETLGTGIINSNEIPGALPAYISKEGTEFKARYHIANEITLKDYLKRPIGREELTGIFENIANILFSAEEKSIDINNYLFNIENIYIDEETKEISFIYIPVHEYKSHDVSIRGYLKSLLSDISYDINDDLRFFVKLHNYLNDDCNDIKEIVDFMKQVEVLKTTEEVTADLNEVVVNDEVYDLFEQLVNESNEEHTEDIEINLNEVVVDDEINNLVEECMSKSNVDDTDEVITGVDEEPVEEIILETTIIGLDEYEDCGTMIIDMDEDEEVSPMLIRKETLEKYEIEKSKVLVGRDISSCDYAVANKSIGRIHATITTIGTNYFIEDNNSTNGTFINSVRLPKMGSSKIKDGDEIKLANEVFIFKLY